MFPLLAKLANSSSNKTNPNLETFRIAGDRVISTNLTTILEFLSPTTKDIDCLVPAAEFIEAWDMCSNPEVFQTDGILTIKEGKFSARIGLLDIADFVIGVPQHETKEGLKPADFVEAIKTLSKSLKTDAFQVVVQNGHLYSTDGTMLIRKPLKTNFPEAIALSKQFVDLVSAIDDQPTAIHLTEDTLTVEFETSRIETARNKSWEKVDCAKLFEGFEQVAMQSFEEEFLPQLKKLASIITDKDAVVSFNETGVNFNRGSKISMKLDGSFESHHFNAGKLKLVLEYAERFNLDDSHMMRFAGGDVQGLLCCVVMK